MMVHVRLLDLLDQVEYPLHEGVTMLDYSGCMTEVVYYRLFDCSPLAAPH